MSLTQNLTYRYVLALLLIATVMLLTYTVLINQIKQNQNDAYIINISGMQRMLSQRIALFTREVQHAETREEAEIYLNKMRKAVERMQSNHKELITGDFANGYHRDLSTEVSEVYFGKNPLDQRVRNYTHLAERFIKTYDQEGWETLKETELTDKITKIARNGLLADLNRVVFLYQEESEKSIKYFQVLETFFLMLGLFILILEALLIFRPMTKRIVTNTKLLEDRNAELTEFTYRISHDLRAPIVSSLGLTEVVKIANEQEDKKQASEALDYIKSSLTQLEVLIDEVINLTKMKQTDVPLEEISLKEEVDRVLEKLRYIEGFQDIEFVKNIKVEGTIQTKAIYLKQNLENLISNAIKYYDPDTPNPKVSIEAEESRGFCEISISDNGLGIPKDYHDKLFYMFKRFHPKVSFGSGLGLYLVKQNAEALGGAVKYKPLDKGSEFIFKFPISRQKKGDL